MNVKAYWDGPVCQLTLNGKQFPKAVAYAMWRMNAREWLNDRPTVSDYEGEISWQTYEEFCSLLKKCGLLLRTAVSGIPVWKPVQPEFSAACGQIWEALEKKQALAVTNILEEACRENQILRLFYGNGETGEDSLSQTRHLGRICKPQAGNGSTMYQMRSGRGVWIHEGIVNRVDYQRKGAV